MTVIAIDRVKKSKCHEPEWLANRIAMAFRPRGFKVGFDECWEIMLREFGVRWYDHHSTVTIDGDEDIFVTEPYDLGDNEIENVKRMARKIGCCLDVWPQANGRFRLIFSRFGWSKRDPLALEVA
jgi:hypothetical protein